MGLYVRSGLQLTGAILGVTLATIARTIDRAAAGILARL